MAFNYLYYGIRNRLRKFKLISNLYAIADLLNSDSHLQKSGWFESFSQNMPCDLSRQALPWYTYPAIAFIKDRINKEMTVFEFGSGNSTVWWSQYVSSVTSCEHDKKWLQFMKQKNIKNSNLLYCGLDGSDKYDKAALNCEQKFDIIIIDGRRRVNCAKNSINALKDDGIIIWDNSNRERYREGYIFLRNHGFKRLDFFGSGPLNVYSWSTSIFYRCENCLGI